MTLLQHNGFRSLRSQLVLSSLLVQVVMLAILVWNSVRITDNALHQLFRDHVDSMVTMMVVSLANPLVQRDYATLDERLERFLQQDSLVYYVVVRDEMGRVVAKRGEVPQTERLDTSFDMPDQIYGQAFDITIAGRVVGRAHYGLNVSLLNATLSNLRSQGMSLALIAVALTFLLLTTLGYLLTQRLLALALAAQAMRGGDYSVRVDAGGRDEVAVTAHAFNDMADTVQRDMAARKLAEAALRESEAALAAGQQHAKVGSWAFDLATRTGKWSAEMFRLFDCEPAAGVPDFAAFLKLVHPDDHARIVEADAAVMKTGRTVSYEYRSHPARGSLQYFDVTVNAILDTAGSVTHLAGTAQDITKRKLAEVALRQSEDHFRTVFEQAPDGIFISDAQGNLLDVNTAGCQQLAYSRGELLQLNIADIIAAEEMPRLTSEIARFKEDRVTQSEWRLRRSDGSTFPAQVAAKQLPDGRLQAFVHDITERKQAEETIRIDSRQMQVLSKRVIEVQEAERRHVARELHDELGQILTAIKINLQARNRLAGQSPVEIDSANIAMVDQAIDQVRRLALALRPSMLDDLGLMAALRWATEQTLQRAGLAVQWHGDLAQQRLAPEIETACYRIAQEAFTNIVRHAQAQSVMITLQHDRERLLLTVHDDGCGFDVGAMRNRATAGGSVGVLGMQERAALVGGKMKIESMPGHGTIIRARFPWRMQDEENI